MSIGLAHDVIVANIVEFAAQITRHHARRYVCCAHQEHKSRGVVFAESLFGGEQKIIDAVLADRRRLQRIDKTLLVEISQRSAHDVGIILAAGTPFGGKLARARIELSGQLQCALELTRAFLLVGPVYQIRARRIAQPCMDLVFAQHLEIIGQRGLH